MSDAVILGIVSTVSVLVAGLGGIILGRSLDRKHERTVWLRDQKVKAYSDFINASDWASVQEGRLLRGTIEMPEYVKYLEVRAAARTAVRIYGSEAARKLAEDADDSFSTDPLDIDRDKLDAALDALAQQCRKELGVVD